MLVNRKYECFVMHSYILCLVCILCASCRHLVAVLNAALCMTCSVLMLVEYARGDHMEDGNSRAGLMTAL